MNVPDFYRCVNCNVSVEIDDPHTSENAQRETLCEECWQKHDLKTGEFQESKATK